MARRIQALRISLLLMSGLALTAGTLRAAADDPPAISPAPASRLPIPKVHQDRALRYGAFVGGTASQYDLCASKGLLPRNHTSKKQPSPAQTSPGQKATGAPAESVARTLIGKLKQPNGGADLSPYALQGWELAKQDLAKHTADFTREKCAMVAATWTALIAGMPSS